MNTLPSFTLCNSPHLSDIAALIVGLMKPEMPAEVMNGSLDILPALLAEFLFTFALVYVISGSIMKIFRWSYIWLYFVAQFSAAAAAYLFKYTHPGE